MLLPYFQWLETVWLGRFVVGSNWLFPVIESIHLLALAVLGGSVLIVDLRLVGWVLKDRAVTEIAREARPWMIGALATMILTGIPLFLSEPIKCYYSPAFWVKMWTLAIALVYVPIFARLTRNLALTVREEPYIQAARLMGQSTARILGREILPNILAPIMVQASISIAFGVIIEAGLSFLGLGVQPPTPSLGVIMADGREYFNQGPWVLTLTGLFISFGLLGLNLLGDGLRDLTDPKLRERTA